MMMTWPDWMALQSGSYWLFGEPMPIFEGENLPIRLRLGFVFRRRAVVQQPDGSAENIALPLRYHGHVPPGEQAARVQQLLELTGVDALGGQHTGKPGPQLVPARGSGAGAGVATGDTLARRSLDIGLDVRDAGWWLHFLGQLSTGHEFMPDKRPTTLVVSVDDLRPWRDRAKQFAVLQEGRFEVLGDRAHLAAAEGVLVKELLADEPATG